MNPELYRGAKEGDFNILVKHKDQLEVQVTPKNNSVLHVSAQFNNNSSIVKEILRLQPLLLSRVNAKGETALHIAAREGHYFTVKALIEGAKGILANGESQIGMAKEMLRMINEDGNTALHEAVWNSRSDHLNVVELLVDEDPQFLYPPNNAEETPLYIATERGFDDIVSKILNKCTSPTYDGPDGRTALHVAVINDFEGCTTQLLAQGESLSLIKKSDIQGWTPLHYAARLGHLKRVEQLLKKDESVAYSISQEDNNKLTTLHVAAIHGKTEVIKQDESVAYSISQLEDNNNKLIALHAAAIHGKTEVIKVLISQCPDCWEMVDSKGHNILHLACIHLQWDVIKFILKEDSGLGGLINQKDEKGNTPLHLLVTYGPTSGTTPDDKSLKLHKSCLNLLAFVNRRLVGKACTIRMIMDGRVDKGAFNKEKLNTLDLAHQKNPHRDRGFMEKHLVEAGTLRGSRNLVKFDNDRVEKLMETRERKSQPLPRDFRKMGDTVLIVAALIATVTFAAGFTIPGGFDGNEGPNQGMAVLTRAAAFKAFVVTDSLAMGFSTGAVFLLLISALSTTPAKIENLFTVAILLLTCGSVAMVIAFMSGIYAVLLHSPGLAISECVIIGFGFLVFSLTLVGYYKFIKLA